MAKIKETIIKATRENNVIYKGTPIRLPSGFSAETLQVGRK